MLHDLRVRVFVEHATEDQVKTALMRGLEQSFGPVRGRLRRVTMTKGARK